MVGALDIKEFVVLSKCAQKMEAIWNEKKKLKSKNESLSKRFMSRNFLIPPPNKSREFRSQPIPIAGNVRKSTFHPTPSKTQATSVASVGSIQNADPVTFEHGGGTHFGVCRAKREACFRCGSIENFVKDCPNRTKTGFEQIGKSMVVSQRGKKASLEARRELVEVK